MTSQVRSQMYSGSPAACGSCRPAATWPSSPPASPLPEQGLESLLLERVQEQGLHHRQPHPIGSGLALRLASFLRLLRHESALYQIIILVGVALDGDFGSRSPLIAEPSTLEGPIQRSQ